MPRLSPTPSPPRIVLPIELAGLHLGWNRNALESFIRHAKGSPDPSELPAPYWVTEPPGELTVDGFVRDTMAFLGELCDGTDGTTLMVSSSSQTDQLSIRMGHMEMHPFIQACMDSVDEDTPLVVVRRMIDVVVPENQTLNFPWPQGQYRQVF